MIDQSVLAGLLAAHQEWLRSVGRSGKQLDLMEADLRGLDLSGLDLSESLLGSADLTGANLIGTWFVGAHLYGSTLVDVQLQDSNLQKADLGEVIATRARFDRANLSRVSFYPRADLRSTCFDGCRMVKTLFADADLRGATMRGAFFDRLSMDNPMLAGLDANGAGGTFIGPDSAIEQLRSAGALVSRWERS